MKVYIDALTKLNVLTSNQEYEITYYLVEEGYVIKVVKDEVEHEVDVFEFDCETGIVTVFTTTEIDRSEWTGNWRVEFTDITPDQIIIEKVVRVTIEELQG